MPFVPNAISLQWIGNIAQPSLYYSPLTNWITTKISRLYDESHFLKVSPLSLLITSFICLYIHIIDITIYFLDIQSRNWKVKETNSRNASKTWSTTSRFNCLNRVTSKIPFVILVRHQQGRYKLSEYPLKRTNRCYKGLHTMITVKMVATRFVIHDWSKLSSHSNTNSRSMMAWQNLEIYQGA